MTIDNFSGKENTDGVLSLKRIFFFILYMIMLGRYVTVRSDTENTKYYIYNKNVLLL